MRMNIIIMATHEIIITMAIRTITLKMINQKIYKDQTTMMCFSLFKKLYKESPETKKFQLLNKTFEHNFSSFKL